MGAWDPIHMYLYIADGNEGMKHGMCINRPESLPMNTKTRSLVLVNHFPDAPEFLTACRHNPAPLMGAVKACYEASGQRWPNFISVDFYKVCCKSDGGGASQAVDVANGHLVCGCDNIAACMENMTKGTCAKQEASEQSALVTIAKLTAQASNTKPAQLYINISLNHSE
ncbi:PREDICTED: PI-PLC X domain-containing protein At5g67130-like [Tarenaya hassleriana]|uniref:PI-PLC X domain-containing protein At5g67130-like n=1 Tax=Tarenaya hassleriana TaxID=28532 RepID=UPI00053C67CC|nr:PREDICTED: PI-PLC X domain-containing protein At5g67130-like [Tarenaya hassleriana]